MNNVSGGCLVLGANGFIGSHIVDALAAADYKVRAFDRFGTPEQFQTADNVETVRGDLYDEMTLTSALENIDYVFHCFSATTPYSSDRDPVSDVEKNLLPSIKIFEQCVQAKVKKVVFISSGGAIYGPIAEEKPASENDAASPVSPYGVNKLAIEGYLAYFKRKHGLEYVAYRLSNPYGPRQVTRNNQGVVPTFVEKISRGEEVTVIGNGTTSRDYVYIGDIGSMIAGSFAQAKQSIYNLGKGEQASLNDIIAALTDILKKEPIVKYVEEPKTFLKHAGISTERFEKEFDMSAETSLQAGLARTVEAFKAQE